MGCAFHDLDISNEPGGPRWVVQPISVLLLVGAKVVSGSILVSCRCVVDWRESHRIAEYPARSPLRVFRGHLFIDQDVHVQALIKVSVAYGYPKWSAKALLETGRALEQKGQLDRAKAQYEEVVKEYPETDAASVARERLDSLTPSQ